MIKCQFAIVGGGIIGLLTAKYLAETGESVTLIEKSAFGSESSWAGGGIISPLYPWRYPDCITALANQAQYLYPSLCDELFSVTGIDPEFQQCGLAMGDIADQSQAIAWAKANGKAYSLEKGSIDTCTIDMSEWLCFPEIAQVRTPKLLVSLIAFLKRQSNVSLVSNCQVQTIAKGDAECQLQTARGLVKAKQVILATGAWTSALFPSANIGPVKGQMIMFGPLKHKLTRIVLVGGRYLIPRKDGRIIVGSTLEHCGYCNLPELEQAQQLEHWAQTIMPSLMGKPRTKHWSGLRPFREKAPLIDFVDEEKRILVNAGHFRNGVVLAPASAHLAFQMLTGQVTELPLLPYAQRKQQNQSLNLALSDTLEPVG